MTDPAKVTIFVPQDPALVSRLVIPTREAISKLTYGKTVASSIEIGFTIL